MRESLNEKNTGLHIIFLCDCSGSMAGERIASVNSSLERVCQALNEKAVMLSEISLRVGIISFANQALWHVPPVGPLPANCWSPLSDTGGITSFGAACHLLGSYLHEVSGKANQLPPVIVLLSDGKPTDDVANGLESLLSSQLGEQSIRYAIGIGDEASGELLLQMSGQRVARTAIRSDPVELKDTCMGFVMSGVDEAIAMLCPIPVEGVFDE